MKRALLAAALMTGAIAGTLVATDTPRGCGARCCQRPESAPVEACLRFDPVAGAPRDFGAGNSMPASHAIGLGCVPAECVVGEGIQLEAASP